jgi:Asp-tRNA(Asn)/Glu-tRNA(Gln) amidotransferase A subunit family amidase
MFDLARETVQNNLPDGPFAGVPFLLKDLLGDFAGVPQTMGSKACKNYIPARDSELVKRYKKAGLVILGKTNTPEFGLKGITEPGIRTIRPGDQAADLLPLSPAVWCQWPRQMMAPDRYAFRLHAAACLA